jgi:hypothetical protein
MITMDDSERIPNVFLLKFYERNSSGMFLIPVSFGIAALRYC